MIDSASKNNKWETIESFDRETSEIANDSNRIWANSIPYREIRTSAVKAVEIENSFCIVVR